MATADVDITSVPFSHDPSAPDARGPARPAPAPLDDLDGLSDLDAEVARALGDVDENANGLNRKRKNTTNGDVKQDDLGLDEQIKVRKPRAPIAKLDEERLLSSKGIPRLRKITKERLRFKGKGHEFSDIGRLLNTYQLWLDDLFPKARFADAINMIEKLGHKKRIQVWRREWIDESKPKPDTNDELDQADDLVVQDGGAMSVEEDELFGTDGQGQSQDRAESGPDKTVAEEADEDIHEDKRSANNIKAGKSADTDDVPDWDELDELLAEDTVANQDINSAHQMNKSAPREEDEFPDEMELMAGIDDPW